MKRLGISAEGATEREFINRVLRPHLAAFGLAVTGIDLRGNVSLDKIRNMLPPLFGAFDFVATFYDFYGFKGRQHRTIAELETAILELTEDAKRRRFFPYIQQYEFEALLFAAPAQTVSWLGGSALAVTEMEEAVRQCGGAEFVNDSPVTSPSHRLRSLFPRYDKKLHGPEVVELVGLTAVRAKCGRLDAWLRGLEQIASA